MISLDEMNPLPERMDLMRQRQTMNKIRVAAPGIVQAYDASQQTVTVQVAIRERMNEDGVENWVEIPLLLDVPIVFPRAGGYCQSRQGMRCWWSMGITASMRGGRTVVYRTRSIPGVMTCRMRLRFRGHGASRGKFQGIPQTAVSCGMRQAARMWS